MQQQLRWVKVPLKGELIERPHIFPVTIPFGTQPYVLVLQVWESGMHGNDGRWHDVDIVEGG